MKSRFYLGKKAFLFVAGGTLLSMTGCMQHGTGSKAMNALGGALGGAGPLLASFDTSKIKQKQIGDQAAVQLNQKYKRSSNRALENHLDKVTKKIAMASGAKDFNYRLYLVDDKQVNAFTPGGGHIFVTTGLVKHLDNEAQVAMVIAHEIAHVEKGHVVIGMRDKSAILLAANSGSSAIGGTSADGQLTRLAYNYAVSAAVNGHGRCFESDADKAGMKYSYKAGYDIREAPRVFEKFMDLHGKSSAIENFFHGDHPTNTQRIKMMRELINTKYKDVNFSIMRRDSQEFRRFAGK